jgi:ABC-type microcin C transport system permease subunit YejB
MFAFIVRRLLITIPMVLIVVSLTWGLIRLAPGNFYDNEKALPEIGREKHTREIRVG